MSDIFWTGVWIAAIAGWFMNLITLCGMHHFSGMMMARVIGVFMFPLGCILGWV